jgi:hypothetical protein
VEALANLELGDLQGRQLQFAVQQLIGSITETDPDNRRQMSMQLYQVLLMSVLTIPELQPRAQDLLQQSRTWLLSEQIRNIQWKTNDGGKTALSAITTRDHKDSFVRTTPPQLRERLTDGELRPGQIIASGAVELVELIGKGGQATVWRGRSIATGESVAVRFLNEHLAEEPEIVSLFRREVDVLTKLSGNAIPRVVQPIMREGDRYFYVTDYIEQTMTFAQVIQNGELPMVKKLGILCSAALSLHEFHQQGFIHGDVKPENILIVGDGVRWIDFGSARRIGEHDSTEPITFTYAYVAPEILSLTRSIREESQQTRVQMRVRMHVGPTLDVYPLGIILFEVLDPGLARIARMEEQDLVAKLLVSWKLKRVILQAIDREPTRRFNSALEFKKALEAAISAITAAVE